MQLDVKEKAFFLNGYLEAFLMISTNATKESAEGLTLAVYWPSNLNAGEVRESLDRIYSTPENRPIPIGDLVSFPIAMRAIGANEDTVQKKIAELRTKNLMR